MTPESFSSLVNLGAAGAVISVVILFLRDRERSDKSWRDYFTDLNQANCAVSETIVENQKHILEILNRIVAQLDAHDARVDTRIRTIVRSAEERQRTRPLPRSDEQNRSTGTQ